MKNNLNHIIDGVVVLYYPESETFTRNIPTYIDSLNRLYIIDNSGEGLSMLQKTELQKDYDSIEFITADYNYGIAKSLNTAANKAMQNGADWLLTMDQDSYFLDDGISVLVDSIDDIVAKNSEAAIISPQHVLSNSTQNEKKSFEEIEIVMTSGNLLNLEDYKQIGPYSEKLFIDYVDHEFCLRLNSKGYKVIINNAVKLIHQLGEFSTNKFFGHEVTSSNHNKIRRYYISRNRMYTMFKFFGYSKKYFLFELKSAIKETLRIIFFENNKLEKLHYTLLGTYHAIIGRYGGLKEPNKIGLQLLVLICQF